MGSVTIPYVLIWTTVMIYVSEHKDFFAFPFFFLFLFS